MEGLYIKHKGDYIENAYKNSQAISLIARGDGSEVMIQNLAAGKLGKVVSCDDHEEMQFAYILEGYISYEENGQTKILGPGDYYTTMGLKDGLYFKTITEVKALFIATRPIFQYISNQINELNSIRNIIENKDINTHDHDRRVRDYAMKIGEKMGLSKEKLENLLYATLFHDLGKINTPEEILNKPGKLTDDEFDIIKSHPYDGKKIVEGTYIERVGSIILEHHERLDGSGYPRGISGEELSVEARIIGIIDSFDAMTSDRPYRKAMSYKDAMLELRSLAGIKYDDEILGVFEEVLRDSGLLF